MLRSGAMLLLVAFCAGTVAQDIQVISLPYWTLGPLPGDALHADVNSPIWGYPTTFSPQGTGAWPVTLSVGDIDNDGALDVLLCMEQRLLLALGFVRDPQGVPQDLYVIWAWFSPTTKVFKHGWSRDTACIGDFDGNGSNEVAALIGPGGTGAPLPCFLAGGNQGSYRVAILGGSPAPDPAFGSLPRPQVVADWPLNSAPHGGWTCNLLHGTNGSTVDCQLVHLSPGVGPGDLEPRDIMVTDRKERRIAVLHLNAMTGTLQNIYDMVPAFGFQQSATGTHTTHAFDINGDGFDEILNNGAIDFVGSCDWDVWPLSLFQICSDQNNHADAIQPWDRDGDGVLELLNVHDCWDFLVEGSPPGCSGPVLIWENTLAPALHGQAICIGEFIPGPDVFGWEAREALITPKGIPGTLGTTGGAHWSYMYNGNSWEMAFCYPPDSAAPAGPQSFDSRNFDWDGDRTADEIFSKHGLTHEVWRLVANAAFSGPVTQDPTPNPFPTSPSTSWPEYPYKFELVESFDDAIWSGSGSQVTSDILGDYREEIITAGRLGIQIAFNTKPLANPLQHPSPWGDLAYRRRMQGSAVRTVNYQKLTKLTALEVFPAITAVSPGSQVTFQAFAVYSSGSRIDVTSQATFLAGPLGTFTGNVFIAAGSGLCAVQANIAGLKSSNAALVHITTDSAPLIVYAGYADSYLVASAPSVLRVEIGVADLEGDLSAVGLGLNGVPSPALLARDDGLGGDRVAGDGLWTFTLPGLMLPPIDFVPPAFSYIEAYAIDSLSNSSNVWPYLSIGGGGGPVTVGFSISPFPSENFTQGEPVRLAATGVIPSSAPANESGSATILARALPGQEPDRIHAIAGQLIAGANINDSGLGADQIANDGLWTGIVPWSGLTAGLYTIELIAQRFSPPGRSDAYPRLRSHQ